MVDKRSPDRELQLAFTMAALGMELVVPILVGWGFDTYFHWAPWGVLVGAVLGLSMVLMHAIRHGNLDDQQSKQHRD